MAGFKILIVIGLSLCRSDIIAAFLLNNRIEASRQRGGGIVQFLARFGWVSVLFLSHKLQIVKVKYISHK